MELSFQGPSEFWRQFAVTSLTLAALERKERTERNSNDSIEGFAVALGVVAGQGSNLLRNAGEDGDLF